MNINGIGGACGAPNRSTGTVEKPEDFLGILSQAARSRAAQAVKTDAVSTADMSMEEYKGYIADKISAIPRHPSQMLRSVSIHISDTGLEAMKNDPEYEKWVLDGLAECFAFNDPWTPVCGGSYAVHYIGATKEEYHGTSWYAGYQGGRGREIWEDRSGGCFWTHDAGVSTERAQQEISDERLRARRKLLEETMEERFWQQKLLAQFFNEKSFDGLAGINGIQSGLLTQPKMAHAMAAYAASLTNFDF